jgi:dihydrofolate synthase/folylpolyglutamate synthase
MIASMLAEHGVETGLYTSPHVIDFTERISVNGKPVERERVVDLVERLKPGADEIDATFFEIVTAAAALHFAEAGLELVVAEVGLGGRLDATNAFDPAVSVITRVAVDHAEVLGSDLATIAAEKAGIIREEGVVVCGAEGVPLDVVRGVAAARKARFVAVRGEASASNVAVSPNGSVFEFAFDGTRYDRLSLSMLGRHQVENAVSAVVTLIELGRLGKVDVAEASVRRGLADACCVGRMQIVDRRPTVLADVAHNPDGARALATAVTEVFDHDRLIAVVGMLGDKDARGFLSELAECSDVAVLTEPVTSRAVDPSVLASIADDLGIPNRIVPTPGAAIESALSDAHEGDLVLITGSHYTVGDVLTSLGVGQALQA